LSTTGDWAGVPNSRICGGRPFNSPGARMLWPAARRMRMLGSPAGTGRSSCPTSPHEASGRADALASTRPAYRPASKTRAPPRPPEPASLSGKRAGALASGGGSLRHRRRGAGGRPALDLCTPSTRQCAHPTPRKIRYFSVYWPMVTHAHQKSSMTCERASPTPRTRRRAATTRLRTARPLRPAVDAGTALAAPVSRRLKQHRGRLEHHGGLGGCPQQPNLRRQAF